MNKNLEKAAKLLGLNYENITELSTETQNGMSAVIDVIQVKSDEDAKSLYDELYRLWHNDVLDSGIKEIANATGISYDTLSALPVHIREQLNYQYMFDSDDVFELHKIVQTAITVSILPDISALTGKSIEALEDLPFETQEYICGMYNMEYADGGDNTELANNIKEYLEKIWVM